MNSPDYRLKNIEKECPEEFLDTKTLEPYMSKIRRLSRIKDANCQRSDTVD